MPNIIVIGASAGGVGPLREIVRALPADLPAAIFIVMHLSPHAPSLLPQILSTSDSIRVDAAVDCERIQPSRVYVARPDLHMLIEPGRVHLTHGPKENRHRPAIDPLFRTAARAYGSRVLGIVLTGLMDDGAVGLHVVKHEGGMAIVQDPNDAMFPSMPESAMRKVPVDFVLPASEIARKIIEVVREPWTDEYPAGETVVTQPGPASKDENMPEEEDERLMGKPSAFTCPDCSGTLWEFDDGGMLRFRCRVGHAYSGDGVSAGYTESVEAALWTAVRSLQESASLEDKLAEQAFKRGDTNTGQNFREIARSRWEQSEIIRNMLLSKENSNKMVSS